MQVLVNVSAEQPMQCLLYLQGYVMIVLNVYDLVHFIPFAHRVKFFHVLKSKKALSSRLKRVFLPISHRYIDGTLFSSQHLTVVNGIKIINCSY